MTGAARKLLIAIAAAALLAPAALAQGSEACEPESMEYHCLRAEAYWAAQWAVQTSASDALAQVSARFAAGDDALAQTVSRRQQALGAYRAAETLYYDTLGASDETVRAQAQTHREAMAAAEAELASIDARLGASFPEYAALTNPRPLTVEETQGFLRADEALVLILGGERASYVFLVDSEGLEWARVEVTAAQTREAVDALRRTLDPSFGRGAWNAPAVVAASTIQPFDRARAYQLYQAFLAPMESRLAGKRHVYSVASGALSSLPLAILVTDEPQGADDDPAALRDTPWLARRFAMTALPSPSSLRALARFGPSRAQRPFFGVGDPCIGVRAGAACDRDAAAPQPGGERGVGSVFGGQTRGVFLADVAEVRQLSALPNTRPELLALASALGAAPDRDLLLGAAATESRIKSHDDLANHRVIAFATHGLIADEIQNLREPALVLTPPEAPTPEDDGLLTASEIAHSLRLDADWVILSACNTAAPNGAPGAESLSGLASAFFFAGARSLLVSHWVVDDAAARFLTTGAIGAMAANPEMGRAEALRASMLELMQDLEYAHPSMWAPFMLVGENLPVNAAR